MSQQSTDAQIAALLETAAVLETDDVYPDLLVMVRAAIAASKDVLPAVAQIHFAWRGALKACGVSEPDRDAISEVVIGMLGTSPAPAKAWVSLTDSEWVNIVNSDAVMEEGEYVQGAVCVAFKLIEAKLREKNFLPAEPPSELKPSENTCPRCCTSADDWPASLCSSCPCRIDDLTA